MPIKQMFLQYNKRCLNGMNDQRFGAQRTDGINQKWNKSDMIQMCVRDKNVINLDHFFDTQISDARSGVNQDIIIQ